MAISRTRLSAKSEIEEAIGRALEPLATAIEGQRQDMRELRQDMRELRQDMGELRQEMRELREQVQNQRVDRAYREARQNHRLLVFFLVIVGVHFNLIAVAIGIILGFN